MQASVHAYSDTEASAVLDDGRLVPFDPEIAYDAGLRHLRPGQRISIDLDEDAWRITRLWVVGIGDDQVIR